MTNISTRRLLGLALASLLPSGCTSTVWDEVNLMPTPDVYADSMLDPLPPLPEHERSRMRPTNRNRRCK
jgi:hypothetical protein